MKKLMMMAMVAAMAVTAIVSVTGVKEVKAAEKKRSYSVAEVQHNLDLLHNINTISAAQLEAQSALELANGTKSQIDNLNNALAQATAQAAVNPSLQPQVDQLNAQIAALTAQYNAQMADYQAKEATYENYAATLPTAGYNPEICGCLYGTQPCHCR